MSQLLKELYNLFNINQIQTSPYYPQTDGLVKRFNKTVKSMLRKLVSKDGKDWDRLLLYVFLRAWKYHNLSHPLNCYVVEK